MKNKKGFTLVELLAVVAMLALIGAIATVAISQLLETSKANSYKESGLSIITGIKQRLTILNRLDEGDFEFTSALVESGGFESPYGDNLKYLDNISSCSSNNIIGDSICKVSTQNCTASTTSFVRVSKVSGGSNTYKYSICLTAGSGNKFINLATEDQLLDKNDNSMISG